MDEPARELGTDSSYIYDKDRNMAFAKALVALQADLPTVPKDSTNPHFRSKYADLPAIWETIRPVLKKHGFAVTQALVQSKHEGYIAMETRLTYETGVALAATTEMPMDKVTPQGYGSAVTYLRRYALGSMLGIVTDEDDDGNTAEGKPGKPTVSAAQVKRLWAIAKKSGFTSEDVQRIFSSKGIGKAEELSPTEYNNFCEWMENNPKKGS